MATLTTQSSEVAAFAAALDDFRRASGRARGRLAGDGDLTLSQYHMLEPLLSAEAPLGVGELACAAGVSAPTATRMLAGLERDALVERGGERGHLAALCGPGCHFVSRLTIRRG